MRMDVTVDLKSGDTFEAKWVRPTSYPDLAPWLAVRGFDAVDTAGKTLMNCADLETAERLANTILAEVQRVRSEQAVIVDPPAVELGAEDVAGRA